MATVYYDPVLSLFILFGLLMIYTLLVNAILSPTKTKRYRKELADLYVSSRIREIASEGNLDISKEYENFKSWLKNEKMMEKSFAIDEVIEMELAEKVEKKVNSKEGK